jgi:5-methylcytosine-specific restriction endonuclease McrA
MEKVLEDLVRRRGAGRCEYCHYPLPPFQFEHIVARQHGGITVEENLALACIRCNSYKGPNLSGIDPETHAIVPLFNPRTQIWRTHFRWERARLVGITPSGRATIAVLSINNWPRIEARQRLIAAGRMSLT